MEKREKPWNRVFHIVEKENCVYNKSLWIFVKEKMSEYGSDIENEKDISENRGIRNGAERW